MNNFSKTGHRAKFRTGRFDINVRRDKKGEFFAIRMPESMTLDILSVDGDHALLMFKQNDENLRALIGHDERQLFVAAISEAVTTVHQAKESLKPKIIKELDKGAKDPHKRKTKSRIRQGDFFFVPAPGFGHKDMVIHNKEPISRGSGRSHICDELVRRGGVTVYNHRVYNRTKFYTKAEYDQLIKSKDPKVPLHGWTERRRDARVYVRGRIRHPEHKTLVLKVWHELISNIEADWLKDISFVD